MTDAPSSPPSPDLPESPQSAESPAERAATSTAPRRDGGPGRLVAVVAVAAVVGGLIGGGVVALVNHRSTSDTTTQRAAGGSAQPGSSGPAMCTATTVANTVLPSIVTIAATGAQGSGTGSGEIIKAGGYIMTNNHVIAIAANGGHVQVLYSDGRTSDATIVGRDPKTDVAVIKASDSAAGLPLIATGSSENLKVGQAVVALGAPLGLASTVTSGIVSALDRYLAVPGDEGQTAHLVGAIQTDAAINPGNSGGALVDCNGSMVGMNSAIATVPNASGVAGGGSVGLGFAIPIGLALPLAEQIISTGTVNHPITGMQVQEIPPAAAARAGVPEGLYVQLVTPGGPAADAGLQVGDIITEIDGRAATGSEQLVVATLTKKAGDTLAITYVRDGTTKQATLTLGAS